MLYGVGVVLSSPREFGRGVSFCEVGYDDAEKRFFVLFCFE